MTKIQRILYVFTLCGLLALPFHAQAWSFKEFAKPFIAKADKTISKTYGFMKKHPFITLGCITSFIGAYKAWQATPSLWTWFFAKHNNQKSTNNEQPINEEKVPVKKIQPKVEKPQSPVIEQTNKPSISNNNTNERKNDNNNNSTREIQVIPQISTSNQPDDMAEILKQIEESNQLQLKDTSWGQAHILNDTIQREMPRLTYLKSAQDQNENHDNNACGLYSLAEVLGIHTFLFKNPEHKSRQEICTEYLDQLKKDYSQYKGRELRIEEVQAILDNNGMHKTPIITCSAQGICDIFGMEDFGNIMDFKTAVAKTETSPAFCPIILNYNNHWVLCALAKQSNKPVELLYINPTNADLEHGTAKNQITMIYNKIADYGIFF